MQYVTRSHTALRTHTHTCVPTHTHTRTQPRSRGPRQGTLACYLGVGTPILKVPVFKQRALKLVEETEGKPHREISPVFPQSIVSFSNFKARLVLRAPSMKTGGLLFLLLQPEVVWRGYRTGMLPREGFSPPPAFPPAERRNLASRLKFENPPASCKNHSCP